MAQIFFIFLKLGFTSFGGPIAHLGFFHNEFVMRKKWIREQEYADLVALCQFLPGPASSQVGMAIGYYRGGVLGALLAWIAFTLPSVLLLILFALTMASLSSVLGDAWLSGLKIAAVAVVAQAVWEMAKKFCSSRGRVLLAGITFITSFFIHGVWGQIGILAFGALVGVLLFKPVLAEFHQEQKLDHSHKLNILFLILFFALLIVLPLLAANFDSLNLKLANIFYRIGALVFGGGHVVLPLMQSSLVDSGWLSKDLFVAGYGVAQAIPGPLFSFAAYLGFVSHSWSGALISVVMIFLPSFLLVIGVLPYWDKIRSYSVMRAALIGVNAVVVGILAAAFYNPIWTSAIFSWKDFLLALTAFWFLTFQKVPSYLVVIGLALLTALPFYQNF